MKIPGPSRSEFEDALDKGEEHAVLRSPLHFNQKYGEFFSLPILKRFFCHTGPSGFEHILKTNAHNYSKDNLYYRRMSALMGKSLLVTEGNVWKHRRKISQPAFQMGMIKHYVPDITNECQSFLQEIKNNTHTINAPINILSLMNHLTLKIALTLFSGHACSSSTLTSISKATYFGNWYVSHAIFISPWKPTLNNLRFYYLTRTLNRELLKIIQERRKTVQTHTHTHTHTHTPLHDPLQLQSSAKPQDLLDRLMTARNEENSAMLTDQEILDEFKTLLLTGHETTAAGLTWMWYLLGEHPEYQHRLEEELERVLGGRVPQFEDLVHLPLLKAIILETFRLYPPIWAIPRTALQADTIEGYSIPAKSLIVLHVFALHRNPRYWDNPNQFYPPRFMGEAYHTLPAFAYLPFGWGQRICIANHLGITESMLVAATLAQSLRFEKIKKTKPILEACISLRPKKGMWMKVNARANLLSQSTSL